MWVWGGLCREESELCKLQAAKPGVTDIDLHADCHSSTLEAGTVSTLAAMHSLLQFSSHVPGRATCKVNLEHKFGEKEVQSCLVSLGGSWIWLLSS